MDHLKHNNGLTLHILEMRGNEFHKSKIKLYCNKKDVDKLGSPFRIVN